MRQKILFIMQTMNGGGAERVLIDLLRLLDKTGYDVDLCVIHEEGVLMNDIPDNINILHYKHFPKYIWLDCKCRKHQWLTPLYYLFEKIAFRIFVKTKYDVVVSFLEGLPLRFHSFIFCKGKTNISWVHSNLNDNKAHLNYFNSIRQEQKAYNQLTAIVFVSDNALKGLNNLFKITKPKQEIIHNFFIRKEQIVQKAQEYKVTKNRFTICCVGRLTWAKRYDRTVNVARLLKDAGLDFDLWILGQGNMETQIREQISRLELIDNVHLLGFKSNPYPYMQASDVFLLTSDVEGGPLVVCEALCLGVPVVSTDVGYVCEVLKGGNNGIVTSFDETKIAKAIISLTKNDSHIRKGAITGFFPDTEKTLAQIYSLIQQ